jgi:hypothetical protein
MKNLGKSLLCGIAALFAITAMANAPTSATQFTPKMMNYQGYLADPSTGTAYKDGVYTIECRLYRQSSGGTAIWGGSYSAYVKGGYFNIMLGDSSGTNLGYTYSNTDLWRALWDDTAIGTSSSAKETRNNLWLGVTPRQDKNNATISSPTEISPRQQLLCGPYAFRAQAAEYANESYSDFTVNGNLTVTGSLSLPSSYSIGGISADSSNIRIGGTSQSSSNLNIYDYAKYMYLYPYYDITVSPYSGNVTFNIPSGKKFRVNNNNFEVSNAQTGLSSSGATTVYAGSSLTLTGVSGATLKSTGSDAETKISAGRNVYIEPAAGKNVYASGKLQWAQAGKTTSNGIISPFVTKTVNVTISASSFYGTAQIDSNTIEYNNYKWMIVGVSSGNTLSSTLPGLNEFKTYDRNSDSHWYVRLDRAGTYSSSVTYEVTCLGIHKDFLNN